MTFDLFSHHFLFSGSNVSPYNRKTSTRSHEQLPCRSQSSYSCQLHETGTSFLFQTICLISDFVKFFLVHRITDMSLQPRKSFVFDYILGYFFNFQIFHLSRFFSFLGISSKKIFLQNFFFPYFSFFFLLSSSSSAFSFFFISSFFHNFLFPCRFFVHSLSSNEIVTFVCGENFPQQMPNT